MSDPDPNPELDPECIPVPAPLRQKVPVLAAPFLQHCLSHRRWSCNCVLVGGHGGDARTVHLPQRSHHHWPRGSPGGYQGTTYSLDYHVTLPFASDVSDQARAWTPLHWRISGTATTCNLDYRVTFPFASDVSDQARQEHHCIGGYQVLLLPAV